MLDGVFRKIVLPEELAKEPPKMELVSLKYYIGAPDAHIPQKSKKFRDESDGTSSGTRKRVKINRN